MFSFAQPLFIVSIISGTARLSLLRVAHQGLADPECLKFSFRVLDAMSCLCVASTLHERIKTETLYATRTVRQAKEGCSQKHEHQTCHYRDRRLSRTPSLNLYFALVTLNREIRRSRAPRTKVKKTETIRSRNGFDSGLFGFASFKPDASTDHLWMLEANGLNHRDESVVGK